MELHDAADHGPGRAGLGALLPPALPTAFNPSSSTPAQGTSNSPADKFLVSSAEPLSFIWGCVAPS